MTSPVDPTQRSRPETWGAIWGAIALGVAQIGILSVLIWGNASWLRWPRFPFHIMDYGAVVNAMIWGTILGYCLGRAWKLRGAGKDVLAGITLRRAGAICFTINVLICQEALLSTLLTRLMGNPQPWSGAIWLALAQLLASVPSQAALFVCAIGATLPRSTQHPVQITENFSL